MRPLEASTDTVISRTRTQTARGRNQRQMGWRSIWLLSALATPHALKTGRGRLVCVSPLPGIPVLHQFDEHMHRPVLVVSTTRALSSGCHASRRARGGPPVAMPSDWSQASVPIMTFARRTV